MALPARLDLHLHGVEALAVDTVGRRLGYERVGVDRLDDSEDRHGLYLPAPHKKHLHLMFRIPSLAVEHRHSTVGLLVDAVGYFLPVTGEYDELRGLPVGVDQRVGDIGIYEDGDPAVDDAGHGVLDALLHRAVEREEEREAHDRHVDYHHRAPYAHVGDLGDESRHDIRASRGAVVDVDRADAQAAQDAPEHDAHRRVGQNRRMRHEIPFYEADEDGDAGSAEYGARYKRLAEHFPPDGYQHQVDSIHGHRHWDEFVAGEVDECAETRHAADHDGVREDKRAEPDRVEDQAERDHREVSHVAHQTVVS